jgi:hypothetical protein
MFSPAPVEAVESVLNWNKAIRTSRELLGLGRKKADKTTSSLYQFSPPTQPTAADSAGSSSAASDSSHIRAGKTGPDCVSDRFGPNATPLKSLVP